MKSISWQILCMVNNKVPKIQFTDTLRNLPFSMTEVGRSFFEDRSSLAGKFFIDGTKMKLNSSTVTLFNLIILSDKTS